MTLSRAVTLLVLASTLCAVCLREATPGEADAFAPTPLVDGTQADLKLDLEELPGLPVPLRGAFVGVVSGAYLVAGGALDIPAAGSLSGSRFLDSIYYLSLPTADEARQGKKAEWVLAQTRLDEPTAFGSAAVARVPMGPLDQAEGTLNEKTGLVCIGGWTADGPTNKVFFVSLEMKDRKERDAKGQEVTKKVPALVVEENVPRLPDLPVKLALSGARLMVTQTRITHEAIYVVGGWTAGPAGQEGRCSDRIYRLSLKAQSAGGPLGPLKEAANRIRYKPTGKWEEIEYTNPDGTTSHPLGNGLLLPLVDVRHDELATKQALYVMGGRRPAAQAGLFGVNPELWEYIPWETDRDESRCGWKRHPDVPAGVEVTTSVPLGAAHLIVLGEKGAEAEKTLNAVAAEKGGNCFLLYHTFTDRWVDIEDDPKMAIGDMFPSEKGFLWVGFVRGPDGRLVSSAHKGVFKPPASRFSAVDYAVVITYFVGMLLVGWYFSRQEKTTEQYFVGGRKIPWWAAGISIWATGVSAISYMSIPAKTYNTDWVYVLQGIIPPITITIAAFAFVPIFRRLPIMSMMEYKEMRFSKGIRTLATVLMVVSQLMGRMSVTILLPAFALDMVTGWGEWQCVLIAGAIATIYTAMGGICAVIWTDVIQTGVMFGGAILALVVVSLSLDGGAGAVWQTATEHHKLRSFDTAWDFTVSSIWVHFVWGIGNLFSHMGQEGMQRAFSTKDVRSARLSLITCGVVSIPGTILFYSIGTALFAYYFQHPEGLDPTMAKNDAIFPLFIAQKFPIGVAGLVVAGIFAAAMSTLDTGMNSIATVVVRDYIHFKKVEVPEKTQFRIAFWLTICSGIFATLVAFYMSFTHLPSVWDLFSKLMGLLGGGFGGVMVLGILSTRATAAGAWVGTIAATIVLFYIEIFGVPCHFWMYGTISMAICMGVGYVASLVLPGKRKDVAGLTVWTAQLRDGPAAQGAE